MKARRRPKLLLVCSSGGHFLQLYSLKPFWEQYEHVWVTFDQEDTRSLLSGARVHWAYQPTNRNLKNFWRNLWLAVHVLRRERPTAVVSTGAGVAVPFIYMARLMGRRAVYIESFARTSNFSLSGRLVRWCASVFLVQWPQLAEAHPKARYWGSVI